MKEEKRSLVLLGSTGSVGLQAADVAEKEALPVRAVSAAKNVKTVEEQVRRFSCSACGMADEDAAKDLRTRLADLPVKVYSGSDGICEMIYETDADTAVNSIIGEAGLSATLASIESGKRLALANKESLVVAGEIVMKRAAEKGVPVLPVDSEHCAVYQCLRAGRREEVKKLILTASGGPFYGKKRPELENITVRDALAHPTWSMGAKITIDSATLMNKGFEVIEAAHLFGVPEDKIEVVVQRESIIHSMVEYIDNSVIAQMSVPDMRLCVQYALSSPERHSAVTDELDFGKLSGITFGLPDTETFVLLDLARKVLRLGGALPAVLNAANETAVGAFLAEKIKFTDIFDCVADTVSSLEEKKNVRSLDGILDSDREARESASEYISAHCGA